MKLYVFPVAPNPTKVRLYLAEKAAGGASLPIEEVQVSLPEGEQNSEEFRQRNPFTRLPVLELDDGRHVFESLPIIEYLEEKFPEPPMIGRTAEERARVRSLERVCDIDVLMSIARIVHATRSPLGREPSAEVAERSRIPIPDALEYLDGLLADGRPFLAGAKPTTADCTLAAAFQFGRFGQVDLDLPGNVRRWDERYRSRPEVASIFLL